MCDETTGGCCTAFQVKEGDKIFCGECGCIVEDLNNIKGD